MSKKDASNPAVYFMSLTVKNINCFKQSQTIDLSNGQGQPAMWTIILGNNNTGKTTLLRALAGLEPMLITDPSNSNRYEPSYEKTNFHTLASISSISSNLLFQKQDNSIITDSISSNWLFDKSTNVTGKVLSHGRSVIHEEDSNSVVFNDFHNLLIDGYGTNRKTGKSSLVDYKLEDRNISLFKEDTDFINVEEWLLGVHLASKNGAKKAKKQLEQIKTMLKNVLPDVKDITIESQNEAPFSTNAYFHTDFGKVRIHDLGSGYQVLSTWMIDFAQRMFNRYPNSANPLAEPAIVLIDEIDLHLHPEWQRKLVKFLSEHFPKTQFIVTAHSPLVVQSADEVNVVILEKEEDHVNIKQPDLRSFKGWTVEEILTELMGMEDQTRSEDYLSQINAFEQALDQENYNAAQAAYEELSKMLHPNSNQHKLLKLQMIGLEAPSKNA